MPVGSYSPNKSTAAPGATVFPYTFKIFDKAHLRVTVDGVVKTEGSHYTVDGVGSDLGGNITFGTPLAGGESVIIERVVPYVRTEDYQPNGSFKEENVDRDLDLRTMQIQQVAESANRALIAPVGATLTQPAIPAPVASKFLRWKSDLSGFENVTVADAGGAAVSPFAETLLDDPNASAARTTLGAGAVGDALFTASTALAARTTLGEKHLRLEDYGGAADGSTDNTPALNAAVAAMAAAGTRIIKLGIGTYVFASKPNDFTTGVILIGEGMSITTLRRDYSAGGDDEGFLTWSGSGSNGGGAYGLMVLAQNGTSSGSMFKFYTGAGDVAGSHWIDQVMVTFTGTGTYKRALLVDGILQTTPGAHGLRDFHCGRAFLLKGASNVQAVRFQNTPNLIVDGLWADGTVTVGGGVATYSKTTDARLNLTCLSQFFIGNSTNVFAEGIVDELIFESSTTLCGFAGIVKTTNGVTDSGTNNFVVGRYGLISWTPSPTNLGGSPTVTGRLVKVGSLVSGVVWLNGSSTSTAGSTYFTGLPISPDYYATCVAASEDTRLGYGTGLIHINGRIYPPSWTSVVNVAVTFNFLVS